MDRIGRIQALRRASGGLQASSDLTFVWLGRCIARAFETGTTIDAALEITPPRGSKTSPARVIRMERQNHLLRSLALTLGTAKAASAVLKGKVPTPPEVEAIVEELRQLRSPTSVFAFSRARHGRSGANS